MSKTLEFYFDFTSPNVYLAYKALPPILERSGATLKLRLCLLGGIFKESGNIAPFFTFQKVKGRLEYEQLELRRFLKAHGIERFQWTPHFPPNTVLMMRAALAVEDTGGLARFVEAGLSAVWERGLDVSQPDVVRDILSEAGLNADQVFELAGSDRIKERLRQNTADAVARGVFGMPSFFVGDEMFFGKDRLLQVKEALEA